MEIENLDDPPIIQPSNPPPKQQNQPSIIFKSYNLRCQQYLKQINIIGETVAHCIDFLEANKNVWCIPLFLVFKRMYLMRIKVEQDLLDNVNFWEFPKYDKYVQSSEFNQLKEQIIEENKKVKNELSELLTLSQKKVQKVQNGKIEKFFNLNYQEELKEQSIIYLQTQILEKIKKKQNEKVEDNMKLLKLQIQILSSLIIMKRDDYDDNEELFDIEMYQKAMEQQELYSVQMNLESLEHKVKNLKK